MKPPMQWCRDNTPDLRMCPYSIALDQGIDHAPIRQLWRGHYDKAVRVDIRFGGLVPFLLHIRDGRR